MERLTERLEIANRALSSLRKVVGLDDVSLVERDAAIKRFELAFETMWKAAKEFLWHCEGLDIASPKGVFRSLRELGVLTKNETEQALSMADDRNLTVHTYNEELASSMYSRLTEYLQLMEALVKTIAHRKV